MADRQAGSLWTPEEDVVLLRHVAKYGTKHWGYLQTAGILPHRDQKACCNRFILLKRKFFQARAKGQRLSFPVVPQPDPVSSGSTGSKGLYPSQSASSSLLRRSSPSRSLQAVPSVSFKKHAGAGSLTPLGAGLLAAHHKVQQGVGDCDRTLSPAASALEALATESEAERTAILHRTMENLPEKPTVKQQVEDEVPSSCNVAVTALESKVRTSPTCDVTKALQQSGGTSKQPMQLVDRPSEGPTSSGSHPANSRLPTASNSVQPAMWRCFNPSLLDVFFPEVSGELPFPTVPDVSVPNASSMAPDELMEQMASAPVKMMFGVNRSIPQGDSNADLYSCGDAAALLGSSAACLDLWDFMHTSASV